MYLSDQLDVKKLFYCGEYHCIVVLYTQVERVIE